MKIGCKQEDLKRGTQIIYVPSHAGDDINHPDVEKGFVTSTTDKHAFCRYWSKWYEGELRTKSCGEATPFDRLVISNTVPDEMVQEMLRRYCPAIK